jgi:hypothetical protein
VPYGFCREVRLIRFSENEKVGENETQTALDEKEMRTERKRRVRNQKHKTWLIESKDLCNRVTFCNGFLETEGLMTLPEKESNLFIKTEFQ